MAKTNSIYAELVPLKLPRLRDDKDSTVFVGWNDHTYKIRRGVTVMVPYGVKKIIDRQGIETEKADDFSRKNTAEAKFSSKKDIGG